MRAKRELPDRLRFLENRRARQKTCFEPMDGRTCVVTGSTSGVGLEAARRLAAAGAGVVMVCRDGAKAERLLAEAPSLRSAVRAIVVADFSYLPEVRRAAAEILAACPRIDVLVNSAGLHSTTRRVTREGFELVFCVDHLAPFLLTSLLLERLEASAPSRVIQVNSEGHRFGGLDPEDLSWERRHYTGLRGYGAAKTAQLLTVLEFADRLRGRGVAINAVHPGDLRTNIGSNNGPLYRLFLRTVIWPFLKDPAISGEALYYLAAAPELAEVSGRYFHLTIEEKPDAPALDRSMAARIWEISRRMTGLES
jgi:NAD(P)-dependent dehydrogenase (short-subunit alcohol dehydrogenase family)